MAFNTVQVISGRGSWDGRRNRYIQLVKILYYKLPANGKQLQYNLYYPTLLGEGQLVRIIEGSDNRRAKITGLNGV